MKTIIKYITLLLAGGVIIPVYQYLGHVKTKPGITSTKSIAVSNSGKTQEAPHFSIVKDAAADILPWLKYF